MFHSLQRGSRLISINVLCVVVVTLLTFQPIHLNHLTYIWNETTANNEITLKCDQSNYNVTLKSTAETMWIGFLGVFSDVLVHFRKTLKRAIDSGKEDYSRFSIVSHLKSSNYDSKSLTGHLKVTINTLNQFPHDVLCNTLILFFYKSCF